MLDHSRHVQSYGKTSERSTAIQSNTFSSARLARMHTALRRHVESGRVPASSRSYTSAGEAVEAIGTMAFDSNVQCGETRSSGSPPRPSRSRRSAP